MRKTTVLYFLVFLQMTCNQVQSQKYNPHNNPLSDYIPFHFGYSIAYLYGNYYLGSNNPDVTAQGTDSYGFELQALVNKRLLTNLSIRALPGIGFNSRFVEINNNLSGLKSRHDIQSVFIGIPILLKYKADRLNNIAPYLIVGINPRCAVNSGIKKEASFLSPYYKVVEWFNVYQELGTGIDFYLASARMGIEFKYSVGYLNNYKRNVDPVAISDKSRNIGELHEYITTLRPYFFVISINVEQ